MEFWSDKFGREMWVFDPGGLPPWRNLQTGVYADRKPSSVNTQFTPSGPYSAQDAQLFPYADQHIPGFPSATGGRAVSQPATAAIAGPPVSLAQAPAPSTPSALGQVPELNPDDFYWKWDDTTSGMIPAKPGEAGATFSNTWWAEANKARADVTSGFPGAGGGRTGPTAAELAIQRSQVDAQNLATFISGTIAELEIDVDSKRLSTEQAIGEFNKRLDAFAEAGSQFQGIQPYTIPIGAEYIPGFGPGEIGERLGIEPRKVEAIQFDPFAMANQIVAESQDLTEIGVPEGGALDEANRIARQFLGV